MRLLLLFVGVGLLASGAVVAQFENDVSPYAAIFFYFGYLHEYSARNGATTIGGAACRGSSRCNFNTFLDAVTTDKGGYNNGVALDVTGRPASRFLASRLQNAGMTREVKWDAGKLVSGTPSGKVVLEDHVFYVLNAASQDKSASGAFQPYLDTMLDALSNMAEINAGYASHQHVRWWRAQGGTTGTSFDFVDMPARGDSSESAGRSVIDIINMGKTWAYEIPKDLGSIPVWTGGYEGFKNPHLGRRWAAARLAFQMCRSGRAYPPGSDYVPPMVPPWG